jgi:hypothetical protein
VCCSTPTVRLISAVYFFHGHPLIQNRREVVQRMDKIEIRTEEFEHADAVEPRHRFPEILFCGETWDLRHLDAFALRVDPDLGFEVDVVVLFTCHCFTHSITRDVRAPLEIPSNEIYEDEVERRVLSKERYELSRRFLPELVKDLPKRVIRYAGDNSLNFFSAEVAGTETPGVYAVFFEVLRDKRRKRRLLLYVQSAYRLERLTNRLAKGGQGSIRHPTQKDISRTMTKQWEPERTTATARGGRRMRGSLSRFRDFPLQVGPDEPGGTAFCAR